MLGFDCLDGALIIDKPAGLTSHDVVARTRRLSGEASIGHLGTLDPAATGVLPLLLGRLTRLAQFYLAQEKEYQGEIRFGFATTTYDAQGEPVGAVSERAPARDEIEAAMAAFRGRIQQVPPPYSAKKVNGVRAYRLAQADRPPVLSPVEVDIRAFELLELEGQRMQCRVVCSSGGYVRSLAHDLGQALGVGAHLSRLRRLRVGSFELAQSHTLEELAKLAETGAVGTALVPPLALLPDFPAVIAPADATAKLLQGRAVNLAEFSRAPLVRVFSPDQRMIAIGARVAGSLFRPKMVFPGQ